MTLRLGRPRPVHKSSGQAVLIPSSDTTCDLGFSVSSSVKWGKQLLLLHNHGEGGRELTNVKHLKQHLDIVLSSLMSI